MLILGRKWLPVAIVIAVFMAATPASLLAAKKPKSASEEALPDPPMAAAKFTFDKIYAHELQFSSDGRRLFTAVTIEGTQFAIQERDPSSGQVLRTLYSGEVQGGHDNTAVSASGRILATAMVDKTDRFGVERTISVINLMSGKPLTTLTGHRNAVGSLSLSGDGRILASGSGEFRNNAEGKSYASGQVRIWNLASRKLLYEQPDARDFRVVHDGVAVSRDGTTAAWIAAKEVHIVNVAEEKESTEIRPRGDIWGVRLSPDGKSVAILGQTFMAVYDIESTKPRCEFVVKPQGRAMGGFTDDGRTFVYSAHYVMVWVDLNTGKPQGYVCLEDKKNYLERFALSPDGKMMAGKFGFSGPGTLRAFDAAGLQTENLDRIAVVAPAELPGSPEDVLEGHSGTAVVTGGSHILKPKSNAHATAVESPLPVMSKPNHGDDVASAPVEQSAAPAMTVPAPAQAEAPPADSKPSASGRAASGTTRGSTRPAHTSTPAPKDDAAAFIGTWQASDSKKPVETWTISRDGSDWKITGTFTKGGQTVGSCHGDSIHFNGTELSFARVLDKKPTADAIATVHYKARVANGRLRISCSGGGKNWSQTLSPASE
jgi:WD40 repeat protein